MKAMRSIRAIAACAALAFAGGGCATAGGGSADAFVAPDGARATPNTGASRLADGIATPPASPAAAPARAVGAATAATPTGDGTTFTWKDGGAAVNVAGDFNNWDQNADALTKQPDGSFTLVKKLAAGRYGYKFVVDGQWKPDPAAKETMDDGLGGKNSLVVVGDGGMATAAPATAAAPPATAMPASGKGRAPDVTADGVRFTYGGAAKTVHLAGDFNAWAPTVDALAKGADGTWSIVMKLPAGSHAYKFVVDGTTWKVDEANPNTIDDGFGGKNSVVVVP